MEVINNATPNISDTYSVTIQTPIQTRNNEGFGQSESACIITLLQAEPTRAFTNKEIAEMIGKNLGAVSRKLSRLVGTGKGSGPVMRISKGFYRYDPSKEEDSWKAFVEREDWKIENLCYCKKCPNGGTVDIRTRTEANEIGEFECDSNTYSDITSDTQGTERIRYPIKLPTGQRISWQQHLNGTEVIRISSNGAPPLSHEGLLAIHGFLTADGFNPEEWVCTSIEYNKDSVEHRLEGMTALTVQAFEGICLKGYQHKHSLRVEAAFRVPIEAKQVIDILHSINNRMVAQEALRIAKDNKERLKKVERVLSHRQKTTTKTTEKKNNENACPLIIPTTAFRTGNEIKAEGWV